MISYRRLFRGWPLLLLLGLAPQAKADCTYVTGNTTSVNFSITSPVSIPFDLPGSGQLLASDYEVPSNPPDVYCDVGTSYGVVNKVATGAVLGGSSYIYPTNVTGVGYQLVHANDTGNFMGPYPGNTDNQGGTSSFSVGTTLRLVQTGPIANGSYLAAGTRLADWRWGSLVPEYFVLSNKVTFTASACTWDPVPAVVLPTVSTQVFSGPDTTAGLTAFSITIHCPTGSTSDTLSVTLRATTANGYSNVIKIANVTGSATRVGVQLLDRNQVPVDFNTTPGKDTATVAVGPAPKGDGAIYFYAQYYAINSGAVTPGTVSATATFTLSYN